MSFRRSIRVLFLSDSHLGFGMPVRNGSIRKCRGDDFFRAFDEALKPALSGHVDVVVHGGDLFYRSRIPVWLSLEVLRRIKLLSNQGIPFCLVPGNHERSRVTHPILWEMDHVHVFAEPMTLELRLKGIILSISGFPFYRGDIRRNFRTVVEKTGYNRKEADIRILCMHHIVEGARVGPVGYRFNSGPQVIRGTDLPHHFSAVFAGHVHRHQILGNGSDRDRFPCTVVYAGSTERTSFAERDETKGVIKAGFGLSKKGRGELRYIDFCPVRTRRMYVRRLHIETDPDNVNADIFSSLFDNVDGHGILRVEISMPRSMESDYRRLCTQIHHMAPVNLITEIRRRYNDSVIQSR